MGDVVRLADFDTCHADGCRRAIPASRIFCDGCLSFAEAALVRRQRSRQVASPPGCQPAGSGGDDRAGVTASAAAAGATRLRRPAGRVAVTTSYAKPTPPGPLLGSTGPDGA